MNKRLGTYITQRIAGEQYNAYIPANLPPNPPINLTNLYPYLEKATFALAELNNITKNVPNISLFVYMYIRKEAVLSSQIEGTQSSLSDLILFEHNYKQEITPEDVEEVSNYGRAIHFGLKKLRDNFPLSLRLLREMHEVLLSGTRGAEKLPGEFRRSQNWIGGTRPGNALFVPPPVEYLNQCLSSFESFLHNNTLPVLINAGIAHVQFETIHPFLDGNGRLGRLLIILQLCAHGLLSEPILYLSLYLKQNRQVYYDLLQQVRLYGTWETWLEFFLEGVYKSAKQATFTADEITKLFKEDVAKIHSLGRARFSCIEVFEYLKRLPRVNVDIVTRYSGMTPPTVRSSLNHMVDLGILEEVTGGKRDKIYIYRRYLSILEEGTEPL
jgi:Fic family protein